MAKIILITGGAKSGKSSRALEICEAYEKKAFVATAEYIDGEMTDRIQRHQAERGPEWTTIEEPLDLPGAIAKAAAAHEVVLVDCLTVWLGNLMHYRKEKEKIEEAIGGMLEFLQKPPIDMVLVTNELGCGIIPADFETRRYRDLLGILNQKIAKAADRVELVTCGLTMTLKGMSDR
jgi:adenosylcobinamide kinase/adenosylcobinamide-phosphate guanylyltransferase